MSEEPIDPLAVYDLSLSPITFDFCNFLAFARLSIAKATGSPAFTLQVFADSWRNVTPREKKYTLNERIWRLHNLIMPICSLAPGISGLGVSLRPKAREDYLGRAYVTSDNKNYLTQSLLELFHDTGFEPHMFRSPEVARDYARRIFGAQKKVALLNTRRSNFEPERDTPSDFTIQVIDELRGLGYSVFLVPDQELGLGEFETDCRVKVINEAAVNLPLRLALHELADVTITTCSGPQLLASLSVEKPNMVTCYPLRAGMRTASPEYFLANGFEIGARQPLPYTPANQVWLWDMEPNPKEVCEIAQSL